MQTVYKRIPNSFRHLARFLICVGVVLFALTGCDWPTSNSSATNCIQIIIDFMPLGKDGIRDEQDWVWNAMDSFNQAYQDGKDPLTRQPLAAGQKPICITGNEMASGNVKDLLVEAVQNPSSRDPAKLPTIFQPAVSQWLWLANADSGKVLFSDRDTYEVARAWVVIAIWKSRLDAIRNKVGYDAIGWEELLQVLTSPNGWQDYGIANGRCSVYYGHTDPFVSSTGLSTLISEFYASARANGFTERTLNLPAVDRSDIQQGVRDIEGMIRHYARNTTIFKNYIARGPDYVDFVALPENDLISINRGKTDAGKPPQPLVALYPKEGTFLHEHPFGIVQYDVAHGGWTTAEQREAALRFKDYVLTPDIQQLIMDRGFRPANPNVPLTFPVSSENGINPDGPATTLDVPPTDVISAIQSSWKSVKKQADIMLLIDVSGSMSSNGKLQQAQAAALAFLNAVPAGDRVGLMTFSNSVQTVVPLTLVEGNLPLLINAVNGLTPTGGTALYAAVKETLVTMSSQPDPNRIRAIVLLSDGEDTASQSVSLRDIELLIQSSQPGINQTCQQAADPVVVLPVAYGLEIGPNDSAQVIQEKQDAQQALNRIARASQTEVTQGDPLTILKILQIIASYF